MLLLFFLMASIIRFVYKNKKIEKADELYIPKNIPLTTIKDGACVACAQPFNIQIFYSDDLSRVRWESEPGTAYHNVEIGEVGFVPGTGNEIVDENLFGFETNSAHSFLDQNQPYDFYIRSICENGDTSAFVGPFHLMTGFECGNFYYDPGGPDSPYAKGGYDYEFCSDVPGTLIQIDFKEIDIDTCCASLRVFTNFFQFIDIPLNGTLPDPIASFRVCFKIENRIVEKLKMIDNQWFIANSAPFRSDIL